MSHYLNPLSEHLVAYIHNLGIDKPNLYDIKSLKGACKGKPFLFCGAGPSLIKNMSKIKEIIDKDLAFVVAGGTAMTHFCRAKVNPHLCVALDPFDEEFARFKGLSPEFMESNTLLAAATLNPRCYKYWTGPMILQPGINTSAIGELVEDCSERIEEGNTGVSTWACNLAGYMEAPSLHLIGVDLSYGKDGSMYGDGINYTEKARDPGQKTKEETQESRWHNQSLDLKSEASKHKYLRYNHSFGREIPSFIDENIGLIHQLGQKTGRICLKLAKNTRNMEESRQKLRELKYLLDRARNHYHEPGFIKSSIYKYFLQDYDVVLEHIYVRTGIYHHSVIRETLEQLSSIVTDVICYREYNCTPKYQRHVKSLKSLSMAKRG